MKLGSFLGSLVTVAVSFGAGLAVALVFAPDLLRNFAAAPLPEAITARIAAAGNFRGGSSIQRAAGRAQLLAGQDVTVLRLTGFDVTPGPDLEVWLIRAAGIAAARDVRAADVISLGPLQGASGDQVYRVPDGLDLSAVGTVAVWSVSAGTLYAVAPLERIAGDGAGQVSDG